ncbi:FBP domain-containing protein [Streptomyces sp. NPDC020875]|uniref:FBP domain-containing protein n=1 Tax=Streptomyces sp. NPDC020875 TaxID=3154898 RepID=UPI00340FB18F
MEPLTDQQIRSSFVNCTKGEAKRLRLPVEFGDTPWADLDFLGWIDPGAPQRAYLVVPGELLPGRDGPAPLGLSLRVPGSGNNSAFKSSLCNICLTGHASSGVSLLVAPLAGPRGREGSTVGIYFCADLACSLYIRGKRQPKLRTRQHEESLTVEEKVARMSGHLAAFVAKVLAD